MAGSLNLCQFIGNLGRDPEIRHTSNGDKIANLSLAVSERWKDSGGQQKEKTEWVRIVVFNKNVADVCERFLSKGSKIYVSGQLQTRKWTDNNGQDRYSTEVVLGRFKGELTMLDGRQDSQQSNDWSSPSESQQHHNDLDDDIPF